MPAVKEAVSSESNSTLVAQRIENAILDHRLQPGTKLTEDELASIYGVGRTVVRGALQTLSHRNLVETKRNRGAFVAQPTAREAREVFEARALLEPRTAHSAAIRARPADLRKLQRHIDREHAALERGDLGRAVYLSGQFHLAIAEIADQAIIAEFIASLVARSSLIIALYSRRPDALCERHAHHALLEAIGANDAEASEELMKSHLVDLRSALDLSDSTEKPRSLRDVLK
ncbi:MAG: GntR family transcriptional regulator [Pseudomonadota bacterium]